MSRRRARPDPSTPSLALRRRFGQPFRHRIGHTLLGVVVAAGLGGAALAQTLGEVVLVSAIASELHPVTSLPSGSLRAEGPGAVALVARLPDAGAWTDWEVFTARGLVTSLEGALVHNVETEFMVAGLARVSREESTVSGTRHVRYVFEGGGRRALLHLLRDGDALVWLLARGR